MHSKLFTAGCSALFALVAGVIVVTADKVITTPTAAQQSPNLATSPLVAVGNGFTYQGRLKNGSNPANGQYDFTFKLYDALTLGNQIGSIIAYTNATVTDGLFTVALDFGSDVFQGDARWLETSVRQSGGGAYTTLSPRQPLTAVPYALNARSAPWLGTSGKPAEYNPSRSGNITTTLDSAGDVGQYTSITIGSDGLPFISYYDVTNSALKVAHCDDLACSSATLTTLDSSGTVGQHTSVTIGTDGLPLISYYTTSGAALKWAHCDNVACTSHTRGTIDITGSSGQYTSITIGTDGLALISYCDGTNGSMKVAHCDTAPCGTFTVSTFDTSGVNVPDSHTSIAIGSDGLGLISYLLDDAALGSDLRVAHCSNVTCSSSTTATIDTAGGGTGQGNSLTIGSDGLGLITFYNEFFAPVVAHCTNTACTSATFTTLESVGSQEMSVTVGPDGLGLISYKVGTPDDLKVAHCRDVTCTSSSKIILDSSGDVGQYNSITIGVDGLPIISYYDATNGDLKVAHCGSPFCISNLHRR